MKKLLFMLPVLILGLILAGCGASGSSSGSSGSASGSKGTITMVWYPNESASNFDSARGAILKAISKATGKKVIEKTTTDYSIAVQAIASGDAQLSFLGGEGYVEAHKKNPAILPLVTNSGPSGTLKDALYNSWLAVNKSDASKYQVNGKYSIDGIAGKAMSFVSTSSTSGFAVPSTNIVAHFSQQAKYKNLTTADLQEGGKFFSKVMFGSSHQGSAVNLLTGRSQVAAFCDTCVNDYVSLASGTANTPGAVYQVNKGAAAPFNALAGKEFTVIQNTPVLNGPIAANTKTLSKKDQKAIIKYLTSDAVTNDPGIFSAPDAKNAGLFVKDGKARLLAVKDSFYDPIRKLSE